MIKLSENAYLDIKIGSIENFLTDLDVMKFSITEYSGFALPQVELLFKSNREDVINSFIENNDLIVKLGDSPENVLDIKVNIFGEKVRSKTSGGTEVLFLQGYIGDPKYVHNKIQTTVRASECNTLEALEAVCTINNFNKKFEIDQVNDQPQYWNCINKSYKDFSEATMSKMDLRPSFPLSAITKENTMILKDFSKLISETPKWNFTQGMGTGNSNDIVFHTSFDPQNITSAYNMYSGYGRNANIRNTTDGNEVTHVSEFIPLLATTKKVDRKESGNRVLNGFTISDNVHPTFYESFFHNNEKRLQISVVHGTITLLTGFKRNINVLDYVNVILTSPRKNNIYGGRYIISGIHTSFEAGSSLTTTISVSRDSHNDIENFVQNSNKYVEISSSDKKSILDKLKYIRKGMSLLRSYLNGTLITDILDYATNLKYQVLSSFSINGYNIDLNAQQGASNTLLNIGSSIQYRILNTFVPVQYQSLFSIGWSNDVSIVNILKSLILQYVPLDYNILIEEILLTIDTVNLKLQTIEQEATTIIMEEELIIESTSSTEQEKINLIVDDIISNVPEVDIPSPIVELTESESLLNNTLKQQLIVDKLIEYLESLGYLLNVDIEYFTQCLLGESILDTITIEKIKSNVSGELYSRYWGTFKDFNELLDYNIRTSYKDLFKVINCTKSIFIKGGEKLYFCAPSNIGSLQFKINGTVTTMEQDLIDLLVFDRSNNKISYTIYYTRQELDRGNVTLEVY